jgi:hypothetical protein
MLRILKIPQCSYKGKQECQISKSKQLLVILEPPVVFLSNHGGGVCGLLFSLNFLRGISKVFPLRIRCRNNWASGVQETYPAQPVHS